jgi:hypothetical protein
MTASIHKASLLLLLLGLAIASSNCIMEDRIVEVVLSDSTCVGIYQFDTTATFHSDPAIVYSDKLDEILENNDVSRDDIVAIKLVSASYGVTEDYHQHDWTISGSITVERTDFGHHMGPVDLVMYTSLTVQGALDTMITAPLESAGVELIDSAFVDFIHGINPTLVFQLVGSSVSPPPSGSDPIEFDWKTCIWVDFVTKTDLEVPDPF